MAACSLLIVAGCGSTGSLRLKENASGSVTSSSTVTDTVYSRANNPNQVEAKLQNITSKPKDASSSGTPQTTTKQTPKKSSISKPKTVSKNTSGQASTSTSQNPTNNATSAVPNSAVPPNITGVISFDITYPQNNCVIPNSTENLKITWTMMNKTAYKDAYSLKITDLQTGGELIQDINLLNYPKAIPENGGWSYTWPTVVKPDFQPSFNFIQPGHKYELWMDMYILWTGKGISPYREDIQHTVYFQASDNNG